MDYTKFTIKTLADGATRIGAGASGLGLVVSFGIAAARNLVDYSGVETTPPKRRTQNNNENSQGSPAQQIKPDMYFPSHETQVAEA